MLTLTKKQIAAVISTATLLGMAAMLVYAAVFFAPNKQPIGYISQPTLSNFNVTAGNAKVYRGEYNPNDWTGKFSCYPVTANGYVDVANPCFKAGAGSPLDVRAASATRMIGTMSDATTGAGVEFSSIGLTAAQKTLMVNTANIDFIRGTSLAPTGLRARSTVLGDIIHSRPYYYTDGTNPTVFVGANDGMLHAFDATTGDERWAYVPSMLISQLPALSSTSYVHDYYVDGSLAIGKSGTKTVLVGSLAGGGKGLYALDISTLTAANGAAAGNKALWEITNTVRAVNGGARTSSTNYANLGDTYSNPIIVPTQDGNDSVIVGNGYNNTGNGHATLYIIKASDGSLIKEIDTGSGSTVSPNGLSSPSVIDTNNDGKADRVYAGDIDGNMWVFDLNSTTASTWSVTKLYATGKAITQAPAVSVHPSGGYMVNFATGRILSDATAAIIAPSTTASADDTVVPNPLVYDAAYGLWDNLSGGTITSGQLISQTLALSSYDPTTTVNAASAVSVRTLATDNKPNWASNRGWTTELNIGGEQVTGDGSFVDNGKFQFNVTNPTVGYTPSGTSVASKGLNWLFQLDFLTGGAGSVPFLDLNRSNTIDVNDRVLVLNTATRNAAASGIPVAYITSNGVQSQPILIQLSQSRIPLYNQNFNAPGTSVTTSATGVNGGHFDVDIAYIGGGGSFGQGGGGPGINTNKHNHEYDKTYDTNGLNFLNPNDTNLNLSNAIPSTTTAYKILAMNQGWNRSMNLRISTNTWNTLQYQAGPTCSTALPCAPYVKYTSTTIPTGAGIGYLDVANLPQYTGNASIVGPTLGTDYTINKAAAGVVTGKVNVINVSTTGSISCGGTASGTSNVAVVGATVVTGATMSTTSCTSTTKVTGKRAFVGGLEFSMPNDGFNVQDWWGDGVVQTGVMPTSPQCPDGIQPDGSTPAFVANAGSQKQVTGPNGERNAGVLTIQIIAANTPNSAVQMNVAGNPKYGFRVIDSQFMNYVLAEYTLYWHHPMGVCMGDNSTTWTDINRSGDPWWPAQENGSATSTGTVTDLGLLKCVNGGVKSGNGNAVSWKSTAKAASTAPSGDSTNGPAGWTISPPPDSSTTLPPCPTYSTTADDPRTASFIDPNTGEPAKTVTTTGSTLTNMMGGSQSSSTTTTGTTSGTIMPGTPTGGVSGTATQTGLPPVARRITWRELIGL